MVCLDLFLISGPSEANPTFGIPPLHSRPPMSAGGRVALRCAVMHSLEHHHVKFARKPWPSSEMIHNFRPWAAELVHMVRTKTDRSTDLLHRATCYRQRKCKLGPGRGPCSLHRCESSSSLLFNNSHLDIKEERSSALVQHYLCL